MTEIINCLFCNSDRAKQVRQRADIVECLNCGVVYLRTRPTKATMYEIYQSYANDTSHMKLPGSLSEAKSHGLRREYFVNEIVSLLGEKTGDWLDIGCGWGALLDYTRETGFVPRGIEMTRNCLDYAAMSFQIPVSNSQFTDSRIDRNSCKVISMVHVLEHIPNPKETLEKVYKTLQPGGMFCGIVPNIDSLCSDVLNEDWVWLDPTHHYVHYSPRSIREKLENAGFTVDRLYTSVGDYDHVVFQDCVRKKYGTNETEISEKVQELERAGKGEEIRFFARRN